MLYLSPIGELFKRKNSARMAAGPLFPILDYRRYAVETVARANSIGRGNLGNKLLAVRLFQSTRNDERVLYRDHEDELGGACSRS